MGYAYVVTVSPGYDVDWHYTPIMVFTGPNAESRAEEYAQEQTNATKGKGSHDHFQVERVTLVSED